MAKKKVLIHTDFPLANTGFGKNARNILEYLFNTDKYELINLAVGSVEGNIQELNRTPWKTLATIQPNKIELIRQQNDPKNWDGISRMAGYGAFAIDDAVRQEKPDVYIGIQDIWGIDFSIEKPWFNKITCALWTTLDSLPILDKAVVAAKKTKNYWSWADFATKALHKMGHTHTKTVRGSLNTNNFYRLSETQRLALRKANNIDPETFIVGFVFRNQLRKSVPNLIQGFKMFKQANPSLKTKLLLHTSWVEGWNIQKLLEEHGLRLSDVLTTYVCRNCGKYEIKSFSTNDENCRFCRAEKSQTTTGPGFGVDEVQLNEIYNLMDVYCHPFTSGGQEIPIQEAKLTELVTLVTNYSCGEDSCEDGAGSLPLDWAEYREPDTMFIKASTYPNSISKQLTKVLNMKPEVRKQLGKTGRQWVIDNFSIEVIGKFLEDFIDAAPKINDDSAFEPIKNNPNPNYKVPDIKDNAEWILHLYHNILDEKSIDRNDDGFKHWMARIDKDLNRQQIEDYFRQVAFKNGQEKNAQGVKFEDLLNSNDKGRVIVVQPGNAEDIFLISSLFRSIKEKYPEWSLYVSTKREYKEIIDGNQFVDKWIEFNPMMENIVFLEGNNSHKGYFNVAYLPYVTTQKLPSFMHNGNDKIDFSLKYN
jgi:glycosyltransferase involved in cell wall biosynthesis